MSKILIVTNHYITISSFRMEFVCELLRKGDEVTISCLKDPKNKIFLDAGCNVIEVEMSRHGLNPIEDYKLLIQYKKIMKQLKPDIVLGFTIKPNIYGSMAAKSLGIPFVANITGLGTAVENGGIVQKIVVCLYKCAFKKVKTIFFQNEENMQFFVDKNIRADAHKMLPGSGVNLEKFKVLPYPSDEIINFVFISRIMKEKGADLYLEAAEFIKNKYPNTEFHICGFCENNYEEIIEKANAKGTIVYHGLIDDVRDILKVSHCTVHPTYYPEGLSNTLLESCVSGRPIITTDRSGCREVLEDRKNGLLVRQNDVKDLIDKIEKFLSFTHQEKIQMGLNGREKVVREFDRNIVTKAYLNEINDI